MSNQANRVYRDSKMGIIELLIDQGGGNVQVNCIMPPRGPGFFVVFPGDDIEAALSAAVVVADRGGLPENANITASVPGAMAAGTVPRPAFQFGAPEVRHAAA